MILKRIITFIFILLINNLNAQDGVIKGKVLIDSEEKEFVQIFILNTSFSTLTNEKGDYMISKLPYGEHIICAKFIGYKKVEKKVYLTKEISEIELDFKINEIDKIDEVVITGTKTYKKKEESQIMVNIINNKTLYETHSCQLSEGLNFQTGLRVETDCQTCNYTQLRINGLGGGYSQILINGKPIFSPLTGLYGMDQIPSNMIDKIEVVKGGGSSLYGSSAIGGTINVITKIPKHNDFLINLNYQNINNQTNDYQILSNLTQISKNKKYGITLFTNYKNRGFYDHNNDNFSEIPFIENTSFGGNSFILLNKNQKLELNIIKLNEYRLGGDMSNKEIYLLDQAEERNHNVLMSSIDYKVDLNKYSSLIAYIAYQNTKREHYTGILPDDEIELSHHILNPPYGTSDVITKNLGFQFNHKRKRNTITFGSEYILDDVNDIISAYNYEINQETKNFAAFLQSDWLINSKLSLLSGIRTDQHNLIDNNIFSPRASLLYKINNVQYRFNYSTGFRAPQAFDTDLHIAFSGGGISRIELSPNLEPEYSRSFSSSVNFDKGNQNFIYGFTLETFLTNLRNTFFLNQIGEDNFGYIFEKQNGQISNVSGINIETRFNYKGKIQFQSGLTIQSSRFKEEVTYINNTEGIKEFIRTPNNYGFAILNIYPKRKISLNINYIYTGRMKVPHFSGAINQDIDEIITTQRFHELNSKISYKITENKSQILISLGFKNIFNSYQNDFDIGKYRDSNFIYGPSQPRIIYLSIEYN